MPFADTIQNDLQAKVREPPVFGIIQCQAYLKTAFNTSFYFIFASTLV